MNTVDDMDALHPGPDPDRLERFNRLQLSAMLDGELGQDEARFLRRRLEHDAELSGCFERWQVCGDVLRGRQVSLLPPDFADRVARGIADGHVVMAPAAAGRRPRLLRWGGGAALAASVALVALFVGRPGTLEEERAAPPLMADVSPVAAPAIAGDAAADASALVEGPMAVEGAALAGAAALAVAEVPRRSSGERASRGQSQRAVLRGAQARQESATRVAAAGSGGARMAGGGSVPAGADRLLVEAAVSSGLPATVASRPWPKASSLTADSSFSVRYGETFPAPSFGQARSGGSNVLPAFPVEAPRRQP